MTDHSHIATAEAGHVNARLVSNRAHARQAFPDAPHLLNNANMGRAFDTISKWPGYTPTPLVDVPDIAAHCGGARVVYKDESTRLGLGAFKALGGAYAVADLVREQVAKGANVGEVTVATATDGNHGRSVAWGAQLAGCNAYGAEVIRVQGNYEVSLADCRADAEANGWHLVSDTSWEGYVDVPRAIMAGYTVMGREIIDQLGKDALTHAFLPIGVGGLAAGVAAPLWAHMGAQLCNLISIESTMSCCFANSIEAGRPPLFDITEETLMAGNQRRGGGPADALVP